MKSNLFIVVACTVASSAYTQTVYDNPYYNLEETYGLSTSSFGGRYPTITFIPRVSLLYLEGEQLIGNKPYFRAKTQDGVEVFVLKNTVQYPKNFRAAFPQHDVIFSSPQRVSREATGIIDEESAWHVAQGEAFKMYTTGSSDVFRLVGTRIGGDEIEGFIHKSHLDELVRHGDVIKLSTLDSVGALKPRHLPRYSISVVRLDALCTKCDEVVKLTSGVDDVGTKRLSFAEDVDENRAQLVEMALNTFQIGKVSDFDDSPSIVVTKRYGAINEEHEILVFDITATYPEEVHAENRAFKIVCQVIYECAGEGLSYDRKLIKSVYLKRIDPERDFGILSAGKYRPLFYNPEEFDKYLGKIKKPFLFSVNSLEQYGDLLHALGDVFEDRHLASYFLAYFNVGVRSMHRSEAGRQYSYSHLNSE